MDDVRRTGEKPAETWRSCSPDTLRMLRERVARLKMIAAIVLIYVIGMGAFLYFFRQLCAPIWC